MNFAVKILLAAFWLILVPTAAGVPFLLKKVRITLSMSFLTGYLFMFSLGEILILPMMLLKFPLHVLSAVFAVIVVLTGMAGVWIFTRQAKKQFLQIKESMTGASVYFWAALLLIALQIAVMVLFAHMDADDSFFVGAATTSWHTDTIFQIDAYTGREYTSLPSRYVLSPFPVFLAMVSSLCAGLHPAIMAHVIYPAVFMMMAYLVQHQLGVKWFPKDRTAQGIYLLLCALLTWFSGYSIYNGGNFQLIRIWQGKALLAAALLPLIYYLCTSVIMEEKEEFSWLLLGMANTGCCLLSSMGIIMAPLVTGIFVFLGLVRYRSIKKTVRGVLCCLPSVILGVIYVMIR